MEPRCVDPSASGSARDRTRLLVMETDEREALFAACSNAGRWGPDDELGTLNLITPDTRRRAAQLVVEGLSVSMAADLSLQHSPMTDALRSHTPFADPAAPFAVADEITLQVHGWGHPPRCGWPHLQRWGRVQRPTQVGGLQR